MPLYEYECDACAQRFEVIQKFSEAPVETCERCGKGPVRRLLSSPAIQFKGSGWYITDYAQKGKSEGKSEGRSEGKSEGKSESSGGSAGQSDASKTEKSGKGEKSESKTEKKSGGGAAASSSTAAKS